MKNQEWISIFSQEGWKILMLRKGTNLQTKVRRGGGVKRHFSGVKHFLKGFKKNLGGFITPSPPRKSAHVKN